MSSLGPYLRELRERRGVSLDEISRVTRVARSYLEALEHGEHAGLPAPVFVRGFVRAYCQVLGEAPDEALALYDQNAGEVADEHAETQARPARGERRRGGILVSLILLVVLGAALLAVTIALQPGRNGGGAMTVAAPATDRPAIPAEPMPPPGGSSAAAPASIPVAPSTVVGTNAAPTATTPTAGTNPAAGTSPTGATTSTPAATPSAGTTPTTVTTAPTRGAPPATPASPAAPSTPATKRDAGAMPPLVPSTATPPKPSDAAEPRVADHRPAETAAVPPPVAGGGVKEAQRIVAAVTSPYRLTARTSEATWMRVRTEDGRQLSEETIPAGQVREWVSNRRFELTVGNAGGIRFELNGHALPLLGGAREVVKVVLPPETP